MQKKIYKYECGGCDGATRLTLETEVVFDESYRPTCVCGSGIPMFLFEVVANAV